MLSALKKVNHAEVLDRLRAEREQLESEIATDTQKASDLAFDAECGDADAKTQRTELLARSASGRERIAQIDEAITSGERAAAEAVQREKERRRAQHERKAKALRRKVARSSSDLIEALHTVEQHFAELTAARTELQSEAAAAGCEELTRMCDVAARSYALTGGLHAHAPLLARALGVPYPTRKKVTVLDALASEQGVPEHA